MTGSHPPRVVVVGDADLATALEDSTDAAVEAGDLTTFDAIETDCVVLVHEGPTEEIEALAGRIDDWALLVVTEDPETAIEGGADEVALPGRTAVLAHRVDRLLAHRRLERERDASRSYHERLAEALPVGVIHHGSSGRIRFANRRARELLGRSTEEIAALSYDAAEWGLTDPDGNPHPTEELPFARVDAGESRIEEQELCVERPDGSRVDLSVNAGPMPLSDGSDGVLVTFEDVTQRVRLEGELEALLGRVTDAFFGLDESWRFTYLNERAEELIGFGDRELVGEDVWEMFPDAEGTAFEREYRRAMETGEPASFTEYYPEPLDAWFEVNAYPDETGLSVYFRDVTERRRRVLELERFETVVETLPTGVLVFDREGVVLANARAEEILGRSAEEMTDLSHDATEWEITSFEGEVLPPGRLPVERVFESGEALFDEEHTVRRPNGTTVYLSVNAAPRSDGGTVEEVTVTLEDVTDRVRLESELAEVFSRVSDAVYAVDEEWLFTYCNERAEELFGRSREELLGRSLWENLPENRDSPAEEAFTRAMESQEPASFEWRHGSRDRWFEVSAYPGETGLSVYVADVTERKRFERTLTALYEMTSELLYAETESAVFSLAVEAATDVIGLSELSISQFDAAENVLYPVSGIGDAGRADPRIWRAFLEGDSRVVDDDDGTTLIVPIGRHGVVVAPVSDPVEPSLTLVELLAQTTSAALDRVERESALGERDRALELRTDRLERLNHVVETTRDVGTALLGADTREQIERLVPERLVAAGFPLAWIGRVGSDDALEVERWAGESRAYLDRLEPDGFVGEPSHRAATDREVVAVSNVASGLHTEGWRAAALAEGYQSALSVPLVHDGVSYGVMSVYADHPGAFDGQSETAFADLGEDVAYAIAAVETRRTLLSDRVIELDLRLHGVECPLRDVATAARASVECTGNALGPEGSARLAVTLERSPDREFRSRVEATPGIERVDGREGERSFEVLASGPTLATRLASLGARPRRLVTDPDGEMRVIAELAPGTDVRAFVERLRTVHPDVELHARRETDRVRDTTGRDPFAALTERQREILTTAYREGYFEWPRERSGQELAADLDISQPTFHRHLRVGSRRLLDALVDGETE
ncbi:PAS domain-containing protein [Natronorarus salvus]|uniref:PAS domain-containing protein n=1 Tax=Natronorarus salvus TaxID=3117733 RepID=UPI002F260CFA